MGACFELEASILVEEDQEVMAPLDADHVVEAGAYSVVGRVVVLVAFHEEASRQAIQEGDQVVDQGGAFASLDAERSSVASWEPGVVAVVTQVVARAVP